MSIMLSAPAEVVHILGSRLREHRLRQGIAQNELAKMAGVSEGALRHLERGGASSLFTLMQVASALGLLNELETLFQIKVSSIAMMEKTASVKTRQRAPRRMRK